MSKDGGPAFPLPVGYVPAVNVEQWNKAQFGMTLRDYFAAAALQGLLAAPSDKTSGLPMENDCATSAFQYADAMLEARGK